MAQCTTQVRDCESVSRVVGVAKLVEHNGPAPRCMFQWQHKACWTVTESQLTEPQLSAVAIFSDLEEFHHM